MIFLLAPIACEVVVGVRLTWSLCGITFVIVFIFLRFCGVFILDRSIVDRLNFYSRSEKIIRKN